MSDVEIRPDAPEAEVTAGWADAQGAPYWQVHIPYAEADVWSSNREALAAWFEDAAAAVRALPAAPAPPLGDDWPDQGPASDPFGTVLERAA